MNVNIKAAQEIYRLNALVKQFYAIDHTGYFTIIVQHHKKCITMQYIDLTAYFKNQLIITWCSKISTNIIQSLLKNKFVINRISNAHCIYIGSELTKAEISIALNQNYIQN